MYEINDDDKKLAQELKNFVPQSIIDIHMHIGRISDLKEPVADIIKEGPAQFGINEVKKYYRRLLPFAKCKGGLAIGFPSVNCDKEAINLYVAEQIKKEPTFKGSICIAPSGEKEARSLIEKNPDIKGLKPYHLFADRKITWDSSIEEYLPEWAWRLADRRNMIITLHMVRDYAIADPGNQKVIRSMCEKYPNAKLVLAHAARCFHAPNAAKGLSSLMGLENVWFDSSAICEAEPLFEIINRFGAKRLMWGSDYPVCAIRGRAVTVGLDFIWLQPDTIVGDNLNTKCRLVVVGLESIRALQTACRYANLTKSEVNDIFYNNAKRLLKI